jgi:dihydrodipicolinate synthase/N-acetylneuraminate lyase
MDSDLIVRLSAHPNIAGVKHTDHDVGKMCREMASAKKSGESVLSSFHNVPSAA